MTAKNCWYSFLGMLVIAVGSTSCKSGFSYEITRSDLDRRDSVQSGGVSRTFELHLPPDYETIPSPVVVLFHGTGATGVDMKYITRFDLAANEFGFMAVYPDASSDWATGCACTEAEAAGVDDVQFIADLLDELDADYGINRDSVFLVGLGEGGQMAQKLACDATDSFGGFATVGTTMAVALAESCVPTRAIPVLMIHGTEDEQFPWDGALDRGLESVLAVDTTAQFWATNNGCGERVASVFFGSDAYYNFDVYIDGFDSCSVDGHVSMYRLDGAEHGWPNAEFAASDEIASFFVGECCGIGALAPSSQ